jgi:dipeptide/tripeptide permease
MVIDVIFVLLQSLNASALITVTPVCIVIYDKSVQFLNAPCPILVILLGIVIYGILVPEK